jgi:hypothetical protein
MDVYTAEMNLRLAALRYADASRELLSEMAKKKGKPEYDAKLCEASYRASLGLIKAARDYCKANP